ncbi:MAG: phenylacetate-CoA oxygenase subunit PaaJ [Bacteroidetes bacterium]|jgi:ring-1,2-phenylacetyl-CoA epoxidase subunit PaaD|nr:phenylacetate-CoA oxygenase subunit PaaJ [Bacteroidota bacterium]
MVNHNIPLHTVSTADSADEKKVWELLNTIPDPDIPVISIVELGIVRNVDVEEHHITITITPSYSGCPAMNVFTEDIRKVLTENGYADVRIKTKLSPAWTTEWIKEEAREKMRKHGIAPPENDPDGEFIFMQQKQVTCPRCGKTDSKLVSQFGSTPCKALWYCNTCDQPFEYFKCH